MTKATQEGANARADDAAAQTGDFQALARASLSTSIKVQLYRYIQKLGNAQNGRVSGGNGSAERGDGGAVRAASAEGAPAAQTKLPPETELAKSFGVSRVTLRRALAELEQEGVIIRMHGRGTYINPEVIGLKPNLMLGMEFLDLIETCGYEASSKVVGLSVAPAEKNVAQQLRLQEGTPLYKLEKAYFADGRLAIVSVDMFPVAVVGEGLTAESLHDQSVFDLLLARTGRAIARDKISMEAVARTEVKLSATARKEIQAKSLLVFHATNYDYDNNPVLADVEYYDTSLINFNLIRVKTPYSTS